MLEEALSDPKYNPSEAASLMLNFVQDLPAGGAVAEKRFFRLFSLLCERAFGPMLLDAKEGFRHQEGGWLSAQVRWDQPPSLVSRQEPMGRRFVVATAGGMQKSRVSRSLDYESVVKLLGTASRYSASSGEETVQTSLIEAISKEVQNRPGVFYPFPFLALPKSTQDAWLAVVDATLGAASVTGAVPIAGPGGIPSPDLLCTDNAIRLFGTVLRVRPEEQNQLRQSRQKQVPSQEHRQPLWLSSGFPSPSVKVGVSPTRTSPNQLTTESPRDKDLSPNVLLSMLEYYLFVFVRYPLAVPVILPKQPAPQGHSRDRNTKLESFGEKIYFHLFRRYLRHFLAHSTSRIRSSTHASAALESELFLRIVIALWLESHALTLTTTKAIAHIEEYRQRIGGVTRNSSFSSPLNQEFPKYDLNMSYDLAQGRFDPPPFQVQKYIRQLIIHVVEDPSIRNAVMDRDFATGANQWCLSQAMTDLQQPFYNYVRTTLRHASVHAAGSPFFTALDSWLIWLEPWNVTAFTTRDFSPKNATKRIIDSVSGSGSKRTSHALKIPLSSEPSKYNVAWEPYIAANIHLYTVPLAIFLRRARELDFSSLKFSRSMQVVQRVFRVYTPEVVHALSRLMDTRTYTDIRLTDLVSRHTKNLGAYGPTIGGGGLSLNSCQADVCSLLEEIYVQYVKTIRDLSWLDRTAAYLEGFFGQDELSRDKKALDSLVKRAKIIAGLPRNYEIFASNGANTSTSQAENANKTSGPSRTSEGYLTEEGREQIVRGYVKCSPMDVTFVGDKMFSRVRSHEIPFLVPWIIRISSWLNVKLGYRINLRFLADYRNLLFFLLMYCTLKTFN